MGTAQATVGPGVKGWKVGDAVIGSSRDIDGACAEYAAVPAHVLTAAPKTVPLADAAALPLVGLTAWQHSSSMPAYKRDNAY